MPDFCQICRGPLEPEDTLGTCSRCLSSVLTGDDDLEEIPPGEAKNSGVDHVADYEVLEVIGSGGMASVYRARHRPLDRIVALKLAHPGPAMDSAMLERFRVEAETVASLAHPNVVQVFGSGIQDGRPYVAMEFVAGGTLADQFREYSLAGANLKPAEFKARLERTVTLMLKITRGVQHAHERAILHRDLKPSNVLLDADGEPKVADFGLAKRLEDGRDLTLSNAVLGTPDYMAPEIARKGARGASSACDVYSLGAMFYHLLTDAPPFHGGTTLETIRRAADEEARPPSTVNARVPEDLAIICLKCLEKEPARRYVSAAALADDLERFLTHQPIVARRTGSAEKLVLWCRRHPRRAAGLAALTLSLLAGTAGVTWQWWQTLKANRALEQSEARLSSELRLATALRLASQARNELEESPPRALLLATAAAETAKGSTARSAAYAALIETLNAVGGMLILTASPKAGQAVMSPDGQWFARLGPDGSATVQHVKREGVGSHWQPHAGVGGGIDWLDERLLCIAGNDGLLSLWRVGEDGKAILLFSRDTGGPVFRLAVIPQTQQVATLSASGALRIWPVTEKSFGEPLSAGEYPRPVALEADTAGRQFVVIHEAGAILVTPGEKTGPVTQTCLQRHATHARFSPDGRWVAVGDVDNKACLYDTASTATHQDGFCFGKLNGDINALAFSPDGQWVACVGNSEVMLLWKVGQSQSAPAIPVRIGGYRNYALAFSPDSKTVYTGGTDHQVHEFYLGSLASAPSESLLRGFETAVSEVLVSTNGIDLVGVGMDGSVRAWNLNRPSGAVFSATRKLRSSVRDLHYSPDGQWLVAATDGRNLHGWRANRNLNPGFILSGHRAEVGTFAFAPDGQWLVSGSYDGTVRFWDWQARVEGRTNFADRVLLKLPARAQVRGVAVHPQDGRIIAVGGAGFIRIATTNAEAPPLAFQTTNSHDLRTVAISPDGRWLAVGGISSTEGKGSVVEFRDLHAPEAGAVRTLFVRGTIQTMTFSRDGGYFAAGGDDRSINLWDLSDSATNAQPRVAPFTTGAVGKLDFAPDGRTIAIASWDGTVRLWQYLDPAAETPVFRLPLGVRACAISPDGRQLAAGGFDARATVWDLDEEVLLRRAHKIAGRQFTPNERARYQSGLTAK